MQRGSIGVLLVAACLMAGSASAGPVSFTKLTGVDVGGNPKATAVYEADLSGNGNILSLTIADNSAGLGGAAGQFSGFDLDAIVLSYTDISDTSQLGTVVPLAVFNFSPAGTFFTPGVQRAPANPKLFGTDVTGTHVDNLVATLGAFDANSTVVIPPAFGFISMGDGGVLSFNLSGLVNTTNLHLYIGEVGDNGEVAAGSVTVSRDPASPVPEPGTLTLLGSGLFAAVRCARNRRRTNVCSLKMTTFARRLARQPKLPRISWERRLVDGAGFEPAASALRTPRSPN